MSAQRFSFGQFVLDLQRGMLFENGTPVPIGSKGLALLRRLIEAGGQVVTRTELIESVWPDTAVEESNLSVQMAQLRKRLGASAGGEEWIATVPRVGYRFTGGLAVADEAASKAPTTPAALSSSKPAIAVLPFNNMSSDPEQDYFAEGLSEDLITDLSKVPGLVVIARNSSFAYKGKSIDVRQIARELGVRYLIEGSIRRVASRVRINAQIVDAIEHGHLWADRFDRDLADIFALQDEIVGRIVDAFAGALPLRAQLAARRAVSIDAYDLATRGRALTLRSPEEARLGREHLARAIEIDPTFAEAYAWLAVAHINAWQMLAEPMEHHREPSLIAARKAVALDPGNADALANLGYVLGSDGNHEEGEAELGKALRVNPNHADALIFLAVVKALAGDPHGGTEPIQRAYRLNPHPPGWYHWFAGFAHYAAGLYEQSVATLLHDSIRGTGSQRVLAASLAQLGRIDEARKEAAAFLAMVPSFRILTWADAHPFKLEVDRQRFIDGYSRAGLPM